MPKICGIYCFIHVPDGRCYVGSSIDIEKRRRAHLLYAKRRRTTIAFQDALIVLGEWNFNFYVLEECAANERFERELFYIRFLNSVEHGFNIAADPTKRCSYQCSDSTRAKLSASAKARSQEYRALRSDISKALWKSEIYRAKATRLNGNRKISPEQRAKLSASMSGRRKTAEHKMQISYAMRLRHRQKHGAHNIVLDAPVTFA